MSTTLTIRNLDENVKRLLRIRAATHGRAMEAEARDILTRAVLELDDVPTAASIKVGERAISVCDSVRGIWKGRITTDEIMKQTREE
jgi:plasmid stability protein